MQHSSGRGTFICPLSLPGYCPSSPVPKSATQVFPTVRSSCASPELQESPWLNPTSSFLRIFFTAFRLTKSCRRIKHTLITPDYADEAIFKSGLNHFQVLTAQQLPKARECHTSLCSPLLLAACRAPEVAPDYFAKQVQGGTLQLTVCEGGVAALEMQKFLIISNRILIHSAVSAEPKSCSSRGTFKQKDPSGANPDVIWDNVASVSSRTLHPDPWDHTETFKMSLGFFLAI